MRFLFVQAFLGNVRGLGTWKLGDSMREPWQIQLVRVLWFGRVRCGRLGSEPLCPGREGRGPGGAQHPKSLSLTSPSD